MVAHAGLIERRGYGIIFPETVCTVLLPIRLNSTLFRARPHGDESIPCSGNALQLLLFSQVAMVTHISSTGDHTHANLSEQNQNTEQRLIREAELVLRKFPIVESAQSSG